MIKIHLSRILGEKRITQKELSRMTKIRVNTISEIYNEKTDGIKFSTLEKICKALDIKIGDLLEVVNKP